MNEKQTLLLAAFAATGVEYAVVGGVAVNAHGYVRATHDLDLFIRPTLENARAAFQALLSLGIPLEGLTPGDLLNDFLSKVERPAAAVNLCHAVQLEVVQ